MKIIGYNFRDKSLIKTALTHSSFSKENKVKNNERLEFLGDRVLGLIISVEIFKKNLSKKNLKFLFTIGWYVPKP